MARIEELLDTAASLTDARDFHDLETASSSGESRVTSHRPTIPSSRTVLGRDFHGMLWEFLATFLNDYLLMKDILMICSKNQRLGIIFSWSETKNFRTNSDIRCNDET